MQKPIFLGGKKVLTPLQQFQNKFTYYVKVKELFQIDDLLWELWNFKDVSFRVIGWKGKNKAKFLFIQLNYLRWNCRSGKLLLNFTKSFAEDTSEKFEIVNQNNNSVVFHRRPLYIHTGMIQWQRCEKRRYNWKLLSQIIWLPFIHKWQQINHSWH